MLYSTTLKLNQLFITYDEFLSVFNIESKKNFDIWTELDSRRQNDDTNKYLKFSCIYHDKPDSNLKSASAGIRKIQHISKGCGCSSFNFLT